MHSAGFHESYYVLNRPEWLIQKNKGYQVKKYLGISLNVCYLRNRLELLLYHTNALRPLSIGHSAVLYKNIFVC